MPEKAKIFSAGSTEVPAYLTLTAEGYTVGVTGRAADGEREYWTAENDHVKAVGDSVLEVLGLVKLFEARGPDWMAEDDEIDAFLERYSREEES